MHALNRCSRTAGGRFEPDSLRRIHCDLGPLLQCRHRTLYTCVHASRKQRSSALACTAQQRGASQQQGHREYSQPPIEKDPEHDTAQSVAENPLEAMLYVAQQEMGMKVVWADPDEAEEEWEDALEDLEDVWMRHPSPPEWAEVAGALSSTDSTSSTTTTSSSSSGAGGSAQSTGKSVPAVTWQQLQEQLQQQQVLVILQIATEDTAGARPVPELVPWADVGQGQQVQHITLQLAELTRDAAAAWQDKAVAVLDTGHHSCLAAAIRLSAVYRLPTVVLLQQEKD